MRRTLKSGQTMIELLIAFLVISVGLFAAVTLIYSNRNLVERDADEVVAINLTREGVELARQKRDSNWLANLPFDTGLVNPGSPTDYTAVPMWEGVIMSTPVPLSPSFDFMPSMITDGTPKLNVIKTTNGLFANDTFGGGTATPYLRMLTFHPICADYTVLNDGSACGAGAPKIGIRVESRVTWTSKTGAHSSVIYDDLYDWR